MNICIALDKRIPAYLYGGTERVVVWLGRGLQEMGHTVSYLAAKGSELDFAEVRELDPARPIDAQLPKGTELVHLHSDLEWPRDVPACMTRHGNSNRARTFHPNTIFVSRKHANNHGAEAFVHLGLDPRQAGAGPPARVEPVPAQPWAGVLPRSAGGLAPDRRGVRGRRGAPRE